MNRLPMCFYRQGRRRGMGGRRRQSRGEGGEEGHPFGTGNTAEELCSEPEQLLPAVPSQVTCSRCPRNSSHCKLCQSAGLLLICNCPQPRALCPPHLQQLVESHLNCLPAGFMPLVLLQHSKTAAAGGVMSEHACSTTNEFNSTTTGSSPKFRCDQRPGPRWQLASPSHLEQVVACILDLLKGCFLGHTQQPAGQK